MKKPLVIITGPTAIGKTSVSVDLAYAADGEIISADSIQIYKYMNIGSAKTTPDEMRGIKHYLIDELMPDEAYNIAIFKDRASAALKEIYAKGKLPVITGGTGFYIQSVLYDIDFTQQAESGAYRKKLYTLAKDKGQRYLYEMLLNADPESAKMIHPNNIKRLVRALEYNHLTGRKISEHNAEQRAREPAFNFAYFVLYDARERMYKAIDRRVDKMIESGLVEEVKSILNAGYSKNLQSMQGIGYKEILRYISGDCSLDEAIREIKINTRHYAKRQMTWFRREKNAIMLYLPDFDRDNDKVVNAMLKIMREKGIINRQKTAGFPSYVKN